jgi:hypothetical protein
MAAASGLVVHSITGRSLAVPLAPIVNTKDICFQLVSGPPTATVALKTCGSSGERHVGRLKVLCMCAPVIAA